MRKIGGIPNQNGVSQCQGLRGLGKQIKAYEKKLMEQETREEDYEEGLLMRKNNALQ